ncbi:unnamed protein product, partial [Brenthis ino]
MAILRFLLGLSFLPTIFTIDIDYFFSSPLRTEKIVCGRFQNIICQIKCEDLSSLCIKNECYCLSVTQPDANSSKHDIVPHKDSAETISHASRPALRHHIAHFCPNLNIARSCIKKCMAVGKPAFCGKDHIQQVFNIREIKLEY